MKFTLNRNGRCGRWVIGLIALIIGSGGLRVAGDPNINASKDDVLIVDRDGDGQVDPGDILRYITIITNSGNMDDHNVVFRDRIDPNTTLVPGSINTTPIARNDLYQVTGNVMIEVSAPGVLANDNDPDGGDIKANAIVAGSSANGGQVNLKEDGYFIYNPPPGFTGNDFFTYSIVDSDGNNGSAIVFISVNDMVWFVNESAVCPCDGRLTSPFNDLAFTADSFDVNATDSPGDVIYIHEGLYNGGVTLLDKQLLIGNGSSSDLATVSGITVAPHSVPLPVFTDVDPLIRNTGITLGQNNTIRGLTIGDTSGTGIRGNIVGTFTLLETSTQGEGGGIDISAGILNVVFDTLSSSSDTDSGISLRNVSGFFVVRDPSSNIKTVTAPAMVIEGVPGGLRVQARFGSIFSGESSSEGFVLRNLAVGSIFQSDFLEVFTSADRAVLLIDNPGCVLFFNHLAVDTTATLQPGLVAINSGTLSVNDGFVSTSNAQAINLDNSNLNITLTSVSSIGGSTPGIELRSTTGNFTVTGDNGAGSGGTISGKTDSNGTNSGIGIRLDNATNISLNNMQLNDFDNFAIHGTNVTNFELNDSRISGFCGNSNIDDEGCILFENLSGRANFLNSEISGGYENNLSIINDSGVLDPLVIDGCLIGLNQTASGNDAVFIESRGTASINPEIANTHFEGARGDLIQTNTLNNSSMDIVIRDNVFENTHSNIVSGGGGITLSGGGIGSNINVTYDISGTSPGSQSFRDAKGNAITANFLNGSGTVHGTIQNNSIGVSGVGGSASTEGSGILVGVGGSMTHSVIIDNNDINGVNGFSGIDVYAAGHSTLNSAIANNIVDEFSGFVLAGMYQMVGPSHGDTATICTDIRNNTFDSSSVSFTNAVFFDQISASAHYNFPGYGGASGGGGASTDLGTYLTGRGNTLMPGAGLSAIDASLTSGITGSGSDCPLPAPPNMALAAPMFVEPEIELATTNENDQHSNNEYVIQQEWEQLLDREDTNERIAEKLSDVPIEQDRSTILSRLITDQGVIASGERFDVEIGTLPPGTRVTITFDVTVNMPPPLFFNVCNQGVVLSDSGSVLTDDPAMPGVDDPTCTRIDLAGDADEDGDVDGFDYILFNACMAGPDTTPEPGDFLTVEECLNYFDFDFDRDVDLRDYNILSQIFFLGF